MIEKKLKQLGSESFKKHLFFCCDEGKAKCCSSANSIESWKHLKKRINQLPHEKKMGLFRSKANCLRICQKGPIMVVYPDAVWYHSCTPEVLDQILEKHILGGEVVEEYCIGKGVQSCPYGSLA